MLIQFVVSFVSRSLSSITLKRQLASRTNGLQLTDCGFGVIGWIMAVD